MATGREDMVLVGGSEAARQLDRDIELAARTDAKVLITGETGVGKDVVARLLHRRSGRAAAPLSTINCAGLPDTLLESELFGHVRGSFTGAFRDKAGLLEAADRGTAFLDEAGEMSLRMQGVLLRFLETGEVQRVGSERAARRVNVRVIAATNRDLAEMVGAGTFREDLYYRLNVIRIHVAPLRERRDDIPVLAAHFLDMFGRHYGVPGRSITAAAAEALRAHRWPGNVRELRNVMERLAVKAPGRPVEIEDVAADCPAPATVVAFSGPVAVPGAGRDLPSQLVRRMVDEGASFWTAVHGPFMSRDLARADLRAVVRIGLERTMGNYRLLVQLFNMPADDYKRFLGFLRKHDCHLPFHPFRAVRAATADDRHAADAGYREAAGM